MSLRAAWRRFRSFWREPPAYWEFVYLDDVANQSLRATLMGSVLEKTIRRASWSESSGASLGTGGAAATLGSSRGGETEVHERAVAESLFEDLRNELEKRELLLTSAKSKAIRVRRKPSAEKILGKALDQRQCFALQSATRGNFLETRIRLRPPEVFMAAAAVRSMAPLLQHAQDLGTAVDGITYKQIHALGDALSWFCSDAVPIVGDSVSHRIYHAPDGSLHVVTESVALALETVAEDECLKRLRIVGSCDKGQFWQEPERVLRHPVDFTTLARLEDVAPVDQWTEAEQIDDLRALGSHVVDQARDAYETVLKGLAEQEWSQPQPAVRTVQMVLDDYRRMLAAENLADAESDRTPMRQDDWAENHVDVDPAVLYEGFRSVEDAVGVVRSTKNASTEKTIETLREKAKRGVEADSMSGGNSTPVHREPCTDSVSLRVKVVALYW